MARFPYTAAASYPSQLMPRLPMVYSYGNRSISVNDLVDTGSTINVMPYDYGLALGLIWDEHTIELTLTGALAEYEAKATTVWASHPQLTGPDPVHLALAWTRANDAPIIFGQTNFFMEFKVCFYRSENYFDVWRQE